MPKVRDATLYTTVHCMNQSNWIVEDWVRDAASQKTKGEEAVPATNIKLLPITKQFRIQGTVLGSRRTEPITRSILLVRSRMLQNTPWISQKQYVTVNQR